MSVNKTENRNRKTARIGKYDKDLKNVPEVNENGHKGRSQRGCFGYRLNKSGEEASR